ncbi:MAG: peptidase E [Candidatus Peribacteria bacterium]|jgi:peptidase E|nr:peptidase E [Candidatus Peribacteria bacterium]
MANKSKLFGKIQNAKVIIGESSGAMIFGEEAINDTKS